MTTPLSLKNICAQYVTSHFATLLLIPENCKELLICQIKMDSEKLLIDTGHFQPCALCFKLIHVNCAWDLTYSEMHGKSRPCCGKYFCYKCVKFDWSTETFINTCNCTECIFCCKCSKNL